MRAQASGHGSRIGLDIPETQIQIYIHIPLTFIPRIDVKDSLEMLSIVHLSVLDWMWTSVMLILLVLVLCAMVEESEVVWDKRVRDRLKRAEYEGRDENDDNWDLV
jgi:hypothetical protein